MASIQGVYVALFGRPADPTGLAYFNGVTNNGADLSAIGDLAATAEYQDKYKGQNNIQIVTAIYNQLFNRNPEEAGLNFFVNALNNGTLNINNIAIAILDGAQGDDKKVVEAKIASANAFTAAIDTPVEDAAYRGTEAAKAAAAWIATITTTAATADAAADELKKIVDTNFVGNTITADAAIATLDGTTGAGTPAVTTTDKNDTINAGAFWDASASVIDAGLGVDTLSASIAAANIVLADSLKGVEIFKATATANATLDVAEAKQLTEVWNAGSATFTLGVSNIAAGTTLGLTGVSSATTTFTFADTTGTSDVANLSVNAATGAGGVTIAGVETLNITNEGTSAIGTVTADAATAVNLSGKGSLDLSLAAGAAKAVTNTSTGTVTIDLSASEKVATYTGSAAVDIVTTNVAGLLANQTINTGAGNDIITVNNGSADFALSLTGGAGNDTFILNGPLNNVVAGTAGDFAKALVTITDFNASEDLIKVDLNGTKAVFNNVDLGNIAAAADLHAAVGVVAGLTAASGYAVFAYKGDTYLFQNDATAGLGAADGLVKIAGLADVSALTDANFAII